MTQRTSSHVDESLLASSVAEPHLVQQTIRVPHTGSARTVLSAEMVALCEQRRDEAQQSWDSAVATRDRVQAAAANGDEQAALQLPAVNTLVLAAAERFQAAVDRLASAAMLRRAYVDTLTGALSRGIGEDHLRHEVDRAHRGGAVLSIVFIDVDGLKKTNDTHGHAVGDDVLRRVGIALRSHLRPYDTVVRVGGDEFVCALPTAGLDECVQRFELVAQELIAQDKPIGISAGYAQLRPKESLTDVCSRADADLYLRRRQRTR